MCKRNKFRTSYDTKEPETFYSNGGGQGVRGGGAGRGGGVAGNSRLPHLAIPDLTSSFLDFRPFIFFFRLRSIDHCCVISPISNTINGLILEIRESTVGYLWFRLRRGGGRRGERGAGVQASRPHTLHSWLPFFCIDFLRLGLLRLRNIEHYIVE